MRRTNLRWRAGAGVAAALLVAVPAHAGQLDPRTEPRRSGPLLERAHGCESGILRYEGSALARASYCYWLYEFDPLMELDLERDHAVAWLQTSVDPFDNWCVTEISSRITPRAPLRIEQTAPRTELRLARPASRRIGMHVDIGGAALEDAHIHQDLRLFPRRLSVASSRNRRALVWRGRTQKTVAAAIGVEASAASLDFSRRLYGLGFGRFRFDRGPGCRTSD